MGVLNVTPDSFSDGGSYPDAHGAVDHALRMMDEGADLVDVGGESTRPGATPVPEKEELERVLPVVSELARRGVPVSIDSQKPGVAQRAIQEGAQVINDIGGLRDPAMFDLAAGSPCSVCVMHMQGTPQTMQQRPHYDDVVAEVKAYLAGVAHGLSQEGKSADSVWLDPGIGFGKTVTHNLQLLAGLGDVVSLGHPVVVGVSRKSFIGRVLAGGGEPLPVEERLEGTLAAQAMAQIAGARVLRVHDVRAARRCVEMVAAIQASPSFCESHRRN